MKRERRLHLMQLNTIIVFTGCILVSGCSRKTENVAQDTIVKSHVREENGREETEKDYDGQDPEPVTSYEDTAETTVEQPKQPQVEQMNTELPAWESAEPAPPQLRQPEPPASESAEPAPLQPQQPEPPASESAEQALPQPRQPEPPASEAPEQPASEAPEPPASEAPEVEVQESSEIHDHQLITQWYGAPPDCSHGGYQMVWCSQCGWVDEEACKSVPPLEHTPVGEEIHHGNCKEDTIVVYTCSQCGEQTGFERHTEPNEHNWVIKKMEIWDEETFTFKVEEVECCEWCNARP